MSASQIVIAVLLGLADLALILSAVGVLAMRGVYDKLHYLAPGGIVGTAAILAAVLIQGPFAQGGVKVILVALLLLTSNPVLTYAAARAAKAREIRAEKPPPLPRAGGDG